jgi:hypothetical protein
MVKRKLHSTVSMHIASRSTSAKMAITSDSNHKNKKLMIIALLFCIGSMIYLGFTIVKGIIEFIIDIFSNDNLFG